MNLIYESLNKMSFIQIICILLMCALLAVGIYNIATEFLIIPDDKVRKTILNYGKGTGKLSSEEIITLISSKIERFIRLDDNYRTVLQKKLTAAEIIYTPEFYVSRAIAGGITAAIFGVPFALIFSQFISWVIVVALFIILGIFSYFKMSGEADEIIKNKTEQIEPELALFASTVQKQLSSTTDIIKIFESYRKICGDAFRHEIDVTIADMKTGSYESALLNLDNRVRSDSLSQIIRGLISVLKGDDQRFYFDMLVHDLANSERERLKRISLKRPSKLNSASALILICFVVILVYIIGYQIIIEINDLM
ncbi:MAG: hypothetical protein K2J11_10195 [Oscillospiraceae bacterium]|nr:hypothetical protein [Oscillospiraceae bacterium]